MTAVKLPKAFASVFGFGGVKQVFSIKRANRIGSLVALIIFLTGAAGVLGYGIYNAYSRWTQFGPAVVWNSIWPYLIIAFVMFGLTGAALWSLLQNSGKAVVIYEEGIAYKDFQGLQSWRWDEFRQMFANVTRHYTNGVYTGTSHTYVLEKDDGEKIILNDTIDDVETLASLIRRETFPLFYRQKAAAYISGETVDFGIVQMNNEAGLTVGKKSYPWDEIEEVSIRKGMLSVKKKGGGWISGASTSAASIPNLEVMLAIIDQVVGIKTE